MGIRTGKLTIDLCIIGGVPGCAADCYPMREWEVITKLRTPRQWPSLEQQRSAIKKGVEILVWTGDAWFGLRGGTMIAETVYWVAIGLLGLAVLVAVVYYGLVRRSLPSTSLGLPLLGVLVAMLACHLFSVDPRYSSWRILTWCGYLAVFYLTLSIPRRWIEKSAGALGWAVALVCVGEFILTPQRTRLLGNPNITAAWLLSLAYLMPSFWPWWWVGGAALSATGSRGAFLGLMGATVVEHTNLRAAAPLLLILALCFVAVRPSTVSNRLLTWKEAGRLFLERPLVGWGPGCYPVANDYEPEKEHADNFILTIAAEMGLVGLAAWGWLLVAVGRLVVRSEAQARLGLVAWGIHNLVDCTLWWPWVGIGVMVCLACTCRERDKGESCQR